MLLKRIVLGVWLASLACLVWSSTRAGAQRTRPQSGDDMPQGRQLQPPYYVFSPDIPKDIVTRDVGAIGLQPFVDNLAWFTFISLNWPAPWNSTQRGVPDRQNVIGGVPKGGGGEGGGGSGMPTGPTVWETYKDTDDIYLNPPVAPSSFDTAESVPPQCVPLMRANPAASRRTLTQIAKISDVLRNFKQAFTSEPLIDQNGQKVWYEVKVNRAYYDYVVRNRFYDSRNQVGKNISFPSSSNTTGDEAAVKVKSAWKIMGGPGSRQPDDPKKFYTTPAFVYDPDTRKCTIETVGLVGLHVVMKTAQLPQWSWATFEHVGNAPDQPGATSGQYNFYNPRCRTCPVNTPPSKTGPNTPTQVVRLVPVDSTAPNALFQSALRSLRADNVWQNYMLVNAQWALTRTNIGVPSQPRFLANTTQETYLQEPVDVKPGQPPHGCINCHGNFAGNRDLDFQLFKAYPQSSDVGRQILDGAGRPDRLPGGGRPRRR
ncbi:MAG TPA: hypothetical protein VGB98_01705 [Pyrinomonadaceae bacterium]|jgi:hypothetical protein